METDGDDSIIEVEVVPNTKEVEEIDLTNSPMPKVRPKTVTIGHPSSSNFNKARDSMELLRKTAPVTNNVHDDRPLGLKSATPPKGTPKSTASASASVAINTTPISATATVATSTSPQEVTEGCSVCFDSLQDIRYASQQM